MSELVTRIKKRRINRDQISFAERYRHCNRCEKYLHIDKDEEIVCALCGETFCINCVTKHQQSCNY